MPNPIPALSPKAYYQNATGLWKDAAGTSACTADADLVYRWDDQSGNGYHALQATSANRPSYLTDSGFKSKPCVKFDGGYQTGTYNWLEVANFPAGSGTTAATVMVAFKPLDASSIGSALFSANDQPALRVGQVEFAGSFASAYTPSLQGMVHTVIYDGSQSTNATKLKHWRNYTQRTLGSFSGGVGSSGSIAAPAKLYVGRADIGATEITARGRILEAVHFDRVLSDAERISVVDYWGVQFFANTQNHLICSGDSRTAGATFCYNSVLPLTGTDSYPLHTKVILGTGWDVTNAGQNGQTWAGLSNADLTAVDTLQDDWRARQDLVVWASANDFQNGTAVQVEANALTYWNKRIEAGFHAGHLWHGIDPWDANVASQSKIPVYAAWGRTPGNLPTGVGIVDYQSHAEFGSLDAITPRGTGGTGAGADYYIDVAHFNDAGYTRLGQITAAALVPATAAARRTRSRRTGSRGVA